MASRSPKARFTVAEWIVGLSILFIAAVLFILFDAAYAGPSSARNRDASAIRAMFAACEAYKSDNGEYPQSPTLTDTLDPSSTAPAIYDPANYKAASRFLWQQLSGHLHDTNPTLPPTGTNYAGDVFKDAMLAGTFTGERVTAVVFIKDTFGNSFGYGTAGLAAQQAYKAAVAANPSATPKPAGYNPTFDLWSTGGKTRQTGAAGTAADTKNYWIKNW